MSIDHSKWFAIVNPKAGSGQGLTDWPLIKELLERKGIEFDFALTQRRYHAVELTVNAISNGFRKILAVGGDGTLNEVVNGVFIQKNVKTTDILIGVVGVGTGNDWQRMYDIPASYQDKIPSLIKENTFLQDVGRVEYVESGIKHTRYFANAAGVGFDAEVARSTNKLKEQGRRGTLLYMYSLLKTLLGYRSTHISLSIDGRKISTRTFSLTLGIGRYNGGGMMQVPNALTNDGLFDITIIRKINRLDVIRNIYRLYNGTILKHPKIKGYQGRSITISSDPPINLEVDGESLGNSPFTFSIVPQSIRVLVGAEFNAVENPVSSLLQVTEEA